MSHESLTLGPLQIGELTVQAINQALQQAQERIDALYGLSGPLEIHNTVAAEAWRVEDEDGQVIHAFGATT